MTAALTLTLSLAGVGSAAAQDSIAQRDPDPITVSEADTYQFDRDTWTREDAGSAQYQPGLFAGIRLRVALGGNGNQPRLRAGLALAPTLHQRTSQGAPEIDFGEGLEFGHRTGHRFSLSAAGQDINSRRLGANEDSEGGLPSWALIGGGVVIAAGIGGLLFYDALMDASE